MDTIVSSVICVALAVVGVIIFSIKDKENPLENLIAFFSEWWEYIRAALWFCGLLLLLALIFS